MVPHLVLHGSKGVGVIGKLWTQIWIYFNWVRVICSVFLERKSTTVRWSTMVCWAIFRCLQFYSKTSSHRCCVVCEWQFDCWPIIEGRRGCLGKWSKPCLQPCNFPRLSFNAPGSDRWNASVEQYIEKILNSSLSFLSAAQHSWVVMCLFHCCQNSSMVSYVLIILTSTTLSYCMDAVNLFFAAFCV